MMVLLTNLQKKQKFKFIQMEKERKWYNRNWFISLTSSFAGVVFLAIYDSIKGKPLFSTLFNVVTFKVKLQIWMLLLIVLIFYIVLRIYNKRKLQKPDLKFKDSPNYLNYRKDNFRNFKWKWKYNINKEKNSYRIVNLKLLCPKCDYSLIPPPNFFVTNYKCPHCGNKVAEQFVPDAKEIMSLIIDNIDNRRYKKIQ